MDKRVIHKYELQVLEDAQEQVLKIKNFYYPLSVIEQNGKIMLYVESSVYEDGYEYENEVTFRVVGTGWEYPKDYLNMVGTVKIGDYVWHVLYVK